VPDLPFVSGFQGRPSVGIPSLRVINAYSEPSPGGPKQTVRIGRPGLTRYATLGSGPILRQLQTAGLFNGALFSISGGALYSNDTLIGTIPYSQSPRMAATDTQLAIVSGGALYVYDGTNLNLIKYFNDGESLLPPFSGVAVLYNIFVFTVAGSNQFFFSQVGDATNINAANFSSAQTTPSPIVEVSVLAEELYFTKTDRTEIWDYTGALTAPFAESPGRTYIRGTPAQNSVVTNLDNALFWLGDDLEVYRSSNVPLKISNAYIDDVLRTNAANAGQVIAFAAGIQGHWFYVMSIPSAGLTFAYDCATKEWLQWGAQTQDQSEVGQFLGQCSTGQGATIWIGSAIDGRVWYLDAANQTDDGATRQVVCAAAIWITGGTQRLNNISLACTRGTGNPAAPNPQAQLRLSYDGGRTWPTGWLDADIGMVGAYRYKATWRNLGIFQQPGVEAEFRFLDPVVTAIEGGSYNEPRV
jgi:Phage stabilisation protein